jgi:hypothetical protein
MIKEGENIVLFKLRIKDELKQVELNNPELLEEYKASTIESIFRSARAEKISVQEARSAVEVIDPDYYGGQTFEEAEKEADELVSTMWAGLVILCGLVFGFVSLVVWLVS